MQKKTVTQYAQILAGLMKGISSAEQDKAISVYVEYLRTERMTHLLPNIIKMYEAHAEEWSGQTKALITTARTLEKKELDQIADVLGKEVAYVSAVDNTLLGGFIAQTKTLHIDASLKQSLSRLSSHLVS
jgi:F0F1-type ATP synthase delta subunit